MQHDLDERHEGHGQPGNLPVGLATAAAALLLLAGCGSEERPAPPEPQRPVVLVSGRDEHGLLAEATVGVSDSPEGVAQRRVQDGTLVRVVGSRGEWIRIRALEGRPVSGWVNDYYLRGTVHLLAGDPACPVPASQRAGGAATKRLPPSVQVEMLGFEQTDGEVWVRVRTVGARREAWVPRKAISELPAPAAARRRSCEQE